MRRVQGHTPGLAVTFTPTAFGNKKDPQPIEVDFTAPTEAEKRAARAAGDRGAISIDTTTGQAVRDAKGLVRVEFGADGDAREKQRAIERHVTAVRNYVGADGKAIDTGARLWTHGEREIVDEVAAEILRSTGLSDPEKKASGAPSDSSPAVTPPSPGTAGPAGEKASTSPDAAA